MHTAEKLLALCFGSCKNSHLGVQCSRRHAGYRFVAWPCCPRLKAQKLVHAWASADHAKATELSHGRKKASWRVFLVLFLSTGFPSLHVNGNVFNKHRDFNGKVKWQEIDLSVAQPLPIGFSLFFLKLPPLALPRLLVHIYIYIYLTYVSLSIFYERIGDKTILYHTRQYILCFLFVYSSWFHPPTWPKPSSCRMESRLTHSLAWSSTVKRGETGECFAKSILGVIAVNGSERTAEPLQQRYFDLSSVFHTLLSLGHAKNNCTRNGPCASLWFDNSCKPQALTDTSFHPGWLKTPVSSNSKENLPWKVKAFFCSSSNQSVLNTCSSCGYRQHKQNAPALSAFPAEGIGSVIQNHSAMPNCVRCCAATNYTCMYICVT